MLDYAAMDVKIQKCLVILGPTSVGKTDLALNLAKDYGGELVACDSRQVYKGLDIGTGKMPNIKDQLSSIKKDQGFWEIAGIRVWMYDVAKPQEQYSVNQYVKDAKAVVDRIVEQGKLPIIVGGTGLYLKGLLYGFDQAETPINYQLREELEKSSLGEVQERLNNLSPTLLGGLNHSEKNNKRRLIRKIEIVMYGYTDKVSQGSGIIGHGFDCLLIGLLAPRPILNRSIDLRLDLRLSQGLIEEARQLHKNGLSFKRMRELGLEYEVLADLLEDKIAIDECQKKLKDINHQYAKRQMTYFKKMKDIHWFDVTDKNYLWEIAKMISDWYN